MCVCGYDCSKKAMFWDSEGMILTHCIPKSTTVTGETYKDVLRTKFLPALREKRPKKAAAVLFHHDNAPHRAARVHQFFDEKNFELLLMLRIHLTSHQAIFGCFQH